MKELSPDDSIGHEIKAINHLLQRKIFTAASKAGLDKVTVMHGWIIGYLINNLDRDIFQKDIECKFAISPSTVTNILKLMEKKGYIYRTSVDSDARLKKITLTDSGKQIGTVIENAFKENEQCVNNILSEEERECFFKLANKLRHGLEFKKAK